MLSTDLPDTLGHLSAAAYCLHHSCLTHGVPGAFGFQWSCSTQILAVLGHDVGNRGRQTMVMTGDFKALTENAPGQLSAPDVERRISFTGAALAQPPALKSGYQLISPLHRVATEYRHEVPKK